MADVLNNADLARQADLAKLPVFSGDPKDQFSAEHWIERIQRAKTSSGWTDDQTNTFIYNALRGNALLWYDSLRRTGINRDDWAQFRTAFLESWSTVRTTRTATVNLADLKQGQNESVTAFYPRVVKAIDDLEALVPGNAFPMPATIWPQAFTDVAAFMNIPVADRAAAAVALVTHGATQAFNHMALNLFISNLRPTLRDELLKTPPANLYAAFQQAITLERLAVEPRRPTLPAMPVEVTPDPVISSTPLAPLPNSVEDLTEQIDALNFKRRQLQQRGQQRSSSTHAASSTQPASGTRRYANRPPASRDTICHYCKKPGHYQIDCRSRQRANAPCVRTSAPSGGRPSGPPSQGPPHYNPRTAPVHHVDQTPHLTQVDQFPYYEPFSYPMSASQDFHYAEG
jgi:hypothetical protein